MTTDVMTWTVTEGDQILLESNDDGTVVAVRDIGELVADYRRDGYRAYSVEADQNGGPDIHRMHLVYPKVEA